MKTLSDYQKFTKLLASYLREHNRSYPKFILLSANMWKKYKKYKKPVQKDLVYTFLDRTPKILS